MRSLGLLRSDNQTRFPLFKIDELLMSLRTRIETLRKRTLVTVSTLAFCTLSQN